MKTRLLFLLALLLLGTALPSQAQTDPVKNRQYYIRQNSFQHADFTPGSFYIRISAGASSPYMRCGSFFPNSGWGCFMTVLALFDSPVTDADGATYHGYAALGTDKIGFAAQGSYHMERNWTTNAWNNRETDGLAVTIPKYIDIDRRVTEISDKTVEFPDWLDGKRLKIVGIEKEGFRGATVWLYLPSSVTYVEQNGLFGCGYSEQQTGDPSIPLCFHEGSSDWPYYGSTVYKDPASQEWKDLNNIESLASNAVAYSYFQHVSDVVNPAKLREWGSGCFRTSYRLESVDLSLFTHPDLSNSIPDECFYNPKAMTTVKIGDRFTHIGIRAFSGFATAITPIKHVTFGSGLSTMGEECFAYGSIDSLTLNPFSPLSTIAKKAFINNSTLSYCNFPSTITRIEQDAFRDCGFSRRFDVPASLEYIGDYAFCENKIMHIYFSHDAAGNLTYVGNKAFTPKLESVTDQDKFDALLADEPWRCHYIVEFEDTVPPTITTNGDPFNLIAYDNARTKYVHRHMIVPMGCAEDYKHSTGAVSKFDHHEYCAKFDLTRTYTKPDYGQKKADGTYDKAPWYIASSAWKPQSRHGAHGDIYTFKPDHGGTLVRLTTTPGKNQMGQTKDVYDAEIVYGYNIQQSSDVFLKSKRELLTSDDVNARTAHAYFKNDRDDNIPKISTAKVDDGIVPPGEGILISYVTPGTYLVPLYGDMDFYKVQTVPLATATWLRMNNLANYDPDDDINKNKVPWSLTAYAQASRQDCGGRLYASADSTSTDLRNLTAAETTTALTAIKNNQWVDFREEMGAPIRELVVLDETTGQYSTNPTTYIISDDANYTDPDGLTYPVMSTTELTRLVLWDAGSVNEEYVNEEYRMKYKFRVKDASNGTATASQRCATYYRTYTIGKNAQNEDIDWAQAALQGADYVKQFLHYNGLIRMTNADPGSHYTAANGLFAYTNGSGTANRYWIDILHLSMGVETESETGQENVFLKNFYTNHEDAQNVLVPCWEPRMVWPAWKVVDEATYNGLKADERHIEKHLYHSEIPPVYLQGMSLADLNALSESNDVEGYVSFGLVDGCFYPARTKALTQPNRSYFRVHTSQLHARHKEMTASGKAVIVDEHDLGSATGITTVTSNATGNVNKWYTLDGRRLHAKPTGKGIYVVNGKKVVIR